MRRFWRRAEPGTVWVDADELEALLRGARRASELDREISAIRAETQARRVLSSFSYLPPGIERDLLADLPLMAAGGLHEEAFAALVGDRVWAEREQQLQTWTNDQTSDAPGGA